MPRVAPLAKCRFTVPGVAEALAAAKPGAELLIDFEFSTLKDELWAKKGWIVARDQIALGTGWDFVSVRKTDGTAAPKVAEDERTVTVACGSTRAVFCRKSGTLCELAMNGRTILKDPAPGVTTGPRFTCFRAFTDNDRWVRDGDPWGENRKEGSFYASGLSQLRYHARPIVIDGNVVKTSVEVTGSKSAGFVHEMEWTFLADGSIEIRNVLVPHGTMPPALPRIGLSWILDRDLERMEYYGRGPRENYIDRCTGSFLGFWTSTVADQFEPYVRPQDNGYKCDVRHVDFLDKKGRGVRFSASAPLFVQALHCAAEDLEFARQRPGQKRWRTPLPVRKEIYLNLDIRQLGLGGGSCGPRPMAKYMFPVVPETWTVRLEPR